MLCYCKEEIDAGGVVEAGVDSDRLRRWDGEVFGQPGPGVCLWV